MPTTVWILETSKASTTYPTGKLGAADCGLGTSAVNTTTTLTAGSGGPAYATCIVSTGTRIQAHTPQGGAITLTISPSANGDMGCGVFYSAVVTDKSAVFTRPDGGNLVTTDHNSYTADTLLSGSGTDASGHNYDADGLTTASLNGTYSGTWKQKTFTSSNGAQFVADDTTVKWTGSTTGLSTFAPPTQRDVHNTSYSGQMPDGSGLGTKTETWNYAVTDNQDGTSINLNCLWTAHHIHENFKKNKSTTAIEYLTSTNITAICSSSHQTSLPQTFQDTAQPSVFRTKYSIDFTQYPPIPSSFKLGINHIDDASVRTAIETPATFTWTWNGPVKLTWDQSQGDGPYTFVRSVKCPIYPATADMYWTTGSLGTANITYAPASEAVGSYRVAGPLEQGGL